MYEHQKKLLSAAKYGDYTAVCGLLTLTGINIDFQDPADNRNAAILLAAQFGRLKIVELLCTNGANLTLTDAKEQSPLALATANRHLQIVKVLLASNRVNVNQAGINNFTALHAAIANGQGLIVEALIAAGADVNMCFMPNIITSYPPLTLAVQANNIFAFNLLLTHPDMRIHEQVGKNTLQHAIETKNIYCIKRLLEHTKIDVTIESLLASGAHPADGILEPTNYLDNFISEANSRANPHLPPLMFAAKTGNLEMTRLLLKIDNIDINAQLASGETALSIAITAKHTLLACELISKPNIDLDKGAVTDGLCETPLYLALYSSNAEVFENILHYHPGHIHAYAARWQVSPLNLAIYSIEHGEYFISRLLQLGLNPNFVADPGLVSLTKLNPLVGLTPLIAYIKCKYEAAVKLLLGYSDNLSVLPNIINGAIVQMSPLYIASSLDSDSIVQYLLAAKANIELQNDMPLYTALHFASAYGNLSVVELLLQHNADQTKPSRYGSSPIALARHNNHAAVLARLYQEPKPSLKAYLHTFTLCKKSNQEMFTTLQITPAQQWLCPVSQCVVNQPVRLDGFLYDYTSLISLPTQPNGARQIPHSEQPYFKKSEQFFLSDVQPARDVQAAICKFITAVVDYPQETYIPDFLAGLKLPITPTKYHQHNSQLQAYALGAIREGNLEELTSYLEQGANKAIKMPSADDSMLGAAVALNHTEMVHALYQESRGALRLLLAALQNTMSNEQWFTELGLTEPEEWCCPISRCVANVPVRVYGVLYDYKMLKLGFNANGSQNSPVSREQFSHADIQPAWDIQAKITAAITAAVERRNKNIVAIQALLTAKRTELWCYQSKIKQELAPQPQPLMYIYALPSVKLGTAVKLGAIYECALDEEFVLVKLSPALLKKSVNSGHRETLNLFRGGMPTLNPRQIELLQAMHVTLEPGKTTSGAVTTILTYPRDWDAQVQQCIEQGTSKKLAFI